ncbi:hypothetical protein [Nocardia carnea]|nr:hypothetical protein [Nocardia carnea]
MEGTAAGYHVCLDALVESLGGEPLGPPDPATVTALRRHYAEAVGTTSA